MPRAPAKLVSVGARLFATSVPKELIPRFRKGVKQVATLGPKTWNKDSIEQVRPRLIVLRT